MRPWGGQLRRFEPQFGRVPVHLRWMWSRSWRCPRCRSKAHELTNAGRVSRKSTSGDTYQGSRRAARRWPLHRLRKHGLQPLPLLPLFLLPAPPDQWPSPSPCPCPSLPLSPLLLVLFDFHNRGMNPQPRLGWRRRKRVRVCSSDSFSPALSPPPSLRLPLLLHAVLLLLLNALLLPLSLILQKQQRQ
jgi:hypothetical protein